MDVEYMKAWMILSRSDACPDRKWNGVLGLWWCDGSDVECTRYNCEELP